MSKLKQLIHEVHRRSLWQVLAIYVAVSWIVLQVVDVIGSNFGLPEWVPPSTLVLLLIALPFVLATAFVEEGIHTKRPTQTETTEKQRGSGAASPAGAAGLLTWRNAMLGAGAALALWGLIAAGWIFLREARPESVEPPPGTPGEPAFAAERYAASLAVMPFDNLGRPEDDHLSDGFTDEVIAQLARIERLKVISRTSVMAIRDANLTLPEIGDTLGVEHILQGTVRESGGQIRVTVELMLAASDAIVWVDTYTRPKENIFDLQDEIAGRVSSALIRNVAKLTPAPTASRRVYSDAYEAYPKGRRAIHARTNEAFDESIAAFRRAITADSTFAPAYAGLASALGLSITYGYEMEMSPYERFQAALRLATHALGLDPGLAEAYGVRSYIEVFGQAPVAIPLADIERAVTLLPNSADMRGWYSHSLTRAGRHEDAIAQAQMAIELDPIAPGRRVGIALDAFAAREHQVALEEARGALAVQPGLVLPNVIAAYALLLLRRPAECLELDLPAESLPRAACLYAVGQEEAAAAIVTRASEAARGGGPALSDVARADLAEGLAIYYARVGDADATLEWHDLAFSLSPDGVDFRLYQGGLFDEVRRTAGFEERVEDTWRSAWATVSGGASSTRSTG